MLIDISVAQQEFIVQQRVSERASNVYHLSSRLTRRQSLISPRDVYSFFISGEKSCVKCRPILWTMMELSPVTNRKQTRLATIIQRVMRHEDQYKELRTEMPSLEVAPDHFIDVLADRH